MAPIKLVHRPWLMRTIWLRLMAGSSRTISSKQPAHPSKPNQDKPIDAGRIRNIGIIAHIDAGKTTTTERMLYYSGLTASLGEVHDGDTVTDYMVQERERGITITTASVSFPWRRHRINLLDTPGHVDFTVEVERSLSVLDGAVVVLDASAGVEAQTVTVWTQADRYRLPRIVYLNKMDKPAASVEMCLKSIRRLEAKPVLIHLPIRDERGNFSGLLDLSTMEKHLWPREPNADGSEFTVSSLLSCESSKRTDAELRLLDSAQRHRDELLGVLSETDEQLSEAILSAESIDKLPTATIVNALRRATIRQDVLPVLIGSSYKNVGVQVLMDSVLKYLPSPVEKRPPFLKYYEDQTCALAFKVIHDKMLGALTFLRLYSGELKTQSKLFNVNRSKSERINKIYTALANEYREIATVSPGNIVAVTGLSSTVTGDTLVTNESTAQQAQQRYASETGSEHALVLAGPQVPDPVFFCSIEAPSLSKVNQLEEALVRLQREDPSLRVRFDEDQQQMVISGMGELHIEIIKDRILKEYGIEAYLGPLQVSYRETIGNDGEHMLEYEKLIGGVKNVVKIKLMVRPSDDISVRKGRKLSGIKVVVDQENNLGKLRTDRLKAIQRGIFSAFEHGPLLSFPVVGVDVELHWFEASYATTPAVIASAASSCVLTAMQQAGMQLLEPIMKLEINVPNSHGSRVQADLTSRRGVLGEYNERPGDIRVIEAMVPLSELVNYSTVLRTISSGTASLSMEFDSYLPMTEIEQKKAYKKITGLSI